MSIQEDNVSIVGMKKSDFEQLQQIFEDFRLSGTYWGRKDYFEARNERLSKWINDINHNLKDNNIIIKEKR